jgi:hypothetical protein
MKIAMRLSFATAPDFIRSDYFSRRMGPARFGGISRELCAAGGNSKMMDFAINGKPPAEARDNVT